MTDLKIEGMTCDHCQRAVKSALESVEGVRSADVDLGRGVARIDGGASIDALIQAVEEEGYQASLPNG